MKKAKKFIALLLALVMILAMAACGGDPQGSGSPAGSNSPSNSQPVASQPGNEPGNEPGNTSTNPVLDPIQPDAADTAKKYTETTTADGWIMVTNEGGDTLGYDPKSGVKIIQVDGFAFKDLDKDGELDGYEDWRNSDEVRAKDLAYHMSGEEIAPYLTHGGWGTFGTTYPSDDAYVNGGGRGGVTRNLSATNAAANIQHAQWVNSMQALCESLDYGIPGVVSTDPNFQAGMIQAVSLAATFDPEYAFEIGQAYSKQLRAAGVHMLLGPQIDLASPTMRRGYETYGEDPALTRDITEAFISGLQSTFDANGNDLGWGSESVISSVKHYVGAGATEAGRDDHNYAYTVFPGNNFEAGLIAFHDGAFRLTHSSTGAAGGVMMNYSVSYSEDKSLGEYVGGLFSEYKYDLLFSSGWTGYIISDWGPISGGNGAWGMKEGYADPERAAIAIQLGMTSAGGYSNLNNMIEAWNMLADDLGEEEALEIMRARAYENILMTMRLELFENPYNSTERVREICCTTEALAYGLESQMASIVMLKNDGTIKGRTGEKLTAYIPAVFTAGSQGSRGYNAATIAPAIDMELAEQYFTVITDTWPEVGTGTDPDGNPDYVESDIHRVSAADIASCDIILVPMTAPHTTSTTDADGNWLPPSIQYSEYTANTARDPSLSGDITIVTFNDGYTMQTREEKENRSYKGRTVAQDSNYSHLEALLYADSVAGDIPVVVLMSGCDPSAMVWTEVEPHADAILWGYSTSIVGSLTRFDEALLKVAAGEYEPNGLLVIGMPASMEAVEAQLEDVPRDHRCYTDANGNTYSFAFGMNWSGKINDSRVQKYGNATPLTECQYFDFFYAK